jgi:hypothetical protein
VQVDLGRFREVCGLGDVVEGQVDDAVGRGGAGAQAGEVVEGAAVHFGAGRRQCCGGRVRAGKADDLMPGVEEFADNRRSDVSRGAGHKDTHQEILQVEIRAIVGAWSIRVK